MGDQVVGTALEVIDVSDNIGGIGSKIVKLYKMYTGDDDAAMQAILAKASYEFVTDLAAWAKRFEEQQGRQQAEVGARLAKLELDDDYRHLFANLAWEARREVTPSRREMLAAAAVALAVEDLPLEAKARFERVLRALDPVDVLTLYGIRRGASYFYGGKAYLSADIANAVAISGLPSRDVLESAGCIRARVHTGMGSSSTEDLTEGVAVTSIGDLVLRVLGFYLRAKKELVPFAPPGREVLEGSRSEAEARSFLTSRDPRFTEIVARLVARYPGRARYDFPKPERRKGSERECVLPEGNRPGRFSVSDLPREDADIALKGDEPAPQRDAAIHKHVVDGVWIYREYFTAPDGGQRAHFEIVGPHDVLRWLGEDLDVPWY